MRVKRAGVSIWWRWLAALAALTMLSGAGCQSTGPVTSSEEQSFDDAVAAATDGLVAQTQALPSFLAKVQTQIESRLAKKSVTIDPMIDAASGQQTGATQALEQRVSARLREKHAQFDLVAFDRNNVRSVQYLLVGTLTRAAGDTPRRPYRIQLALVDVAARKVIAQSSALARDQGLDSRPSPYYEDSPVLVKDQVVDGYVRTTQTTPGRAADAHYLDRLVASAIIKDATTAYNASRYQESLGLYKESMGTAEGEELRSLNGVYLSSWKLGRMAEAEEAFGKVVAYGLNTRNLGVKFLFNPGTTDFWSDSKISGPYPMWLRQIARQAGTARTCVDVVGHTSRTGSAPTNDRLSLARAAMIRERLVAEAGGDLSGRTKASGMGWRENLVGTGTDDVTDALDRRVEFRIVDCA